MKKYFLSVLLGTLSLLASNATTFLFIGDSITDGNWGSPSKYPCSSSERNQWDRNHILGHGYVEMTAGYFMGEFPENDNNFINRGISGETLYQIVNRWDEDAIKFNPEIISLLCGTNDIHYWLEKSPTNVSEFDFKDYKNTLDSLVTYTESVLPSSKIVLCTPFVAKAGYAGKVSDYDLRKVAVDSIAEITREVAANHQNKVTLVDFNQLLNNLLKENPNPEYWVWDGIHPSTAMHYRMSRLWIDSLTK